MKARMFAMGLGLLGYAYGDVQVTSLDRIVVQGSNIGNLLVLRAPVLTASGNCHIGQDWYSIFYIPVTDEKAKFIQSSSLASYSMGKNVKLHFNTGDAQAGTTHGQTMCQLTAVEATSE